MATQFCDVCYREINLIDSPGGSWWSHVIHPQDDHDAILRDFWDAEVFNERGKWKYSVKINMMKPDQWVDYLFPINEGMASTPPEVRGVSFTRVPENWSLVMVESPWGYPIKVEGTA